MRKYLFLIFGLLLLFQLRSHAQVPDFTVVDTDGQSHHLYDYLDDGKIVVLDFFYVGCSYCQYYSGHIQQSYENFGCNKGDVVFLGIDWNDTDEEVQAFDSTYGLSYPSASGIEGGADTVNSLYQISYYTTLLVIGPDTQIWKNIKPPTTVNIDSFLVLVGAQKMPCNVGIANTVASHDDLRILQNPISEGQNISLQSTKDFEVNFELYDINGRLLLQQMIQLSKGENSISVQHQLKSGVYFIHTKGRESSYQFKLLVQ